MSATEYYNHTTFPTAGSSGSSSSMRAELEAIETGFGKLPDIAGSGGKLVVVNAGATALTALASGALTEILVGGGAGAVPVWTAATGSGAPVRATAPTLTGLTVSGGTFVSRGITDNATATVMTLASSNEQTQIANATNGITNKYNGRTSDNLGAHYFYNFDGTTNQVKFTWSASETRLDNLNGVTTLHMNGAEKFRLAADGTTTLGGTSTEPSLKVGIVASQVNYINIFPSAAGSTPSIYPNGSDANITMIYGTKAAGNHDFYTDNYVGAPLQVRIKHTASADRYITLTGSNGGNPTIDTSAGSLAVTPQLSGANHIIAGAATAPGAGGVGSLGFFMSSSNVFICAGSGAPTISAAKGSLYLRTDGSSTSTRMYVNTDGGTTWTNLVTAA